MIKITLLSLSFILVSGAARDLNAFASAPAYEGDWVGVGTASAYEECEFGGESTLNLENNWLNAIDLSCQISEVRSLSASKWMFSAICQNDARQSKESIRIEFKNQRLAVSMQGRTNVYQRCPPKTVEPLRSADRARQNPPNAVQMRLLNNIDLPSNDYRTLRNIRLERCKNACAADTKCRAFTYNRMARICFLKSDAPHQFKFVGATSGVKILQKPKRCRDTDAVYVGPPDANGNRIFAEFGESESETRMPFILSARTKTGKKMWEHESNFVCGQGGAACSLALGYTDEHAKSISCKDFPDARHCRKFHVVFVDRENLPLDQAAQNEPSDLLVIGGLTEAFWYDYQLHSGLDVKLIGKDNYKGRVPEAFHFHSCNSKTAVRSDAASDMDIGR